MCLPFDPLSPHLVLLWGNPVLDDAFLRYGWSCKYIYTVEHTSKFTVTHCTVCLYIQYNMCIHRRVPHYSVCLTVHMSQHTSGLHCRLLDCNLRGNEGGCGRGRGKGSTRSLLAVINLDIVPSASAPTRFLFPSCSTTSFLEIKLDVIWRLSVFGRFPLCSSLNCLHCRVSLVTAIVIFGQVLVLAGRQQELRGGPSPCRCWALEYTQSHVIKHATYTEEENVRLILTIVFFYVCSTLYIHVIMVHMYCTMARKSKKQWY